MSESHALATFRIKVLASVDLQQQQQQQHVGFKFRLTDIPRYKHQFSASSS